MKKTLCVDFDGVIHSYKSKWVDAHTILDEPVPGAFTWLEAMLDSEDFEVCIYSSRSREPGACAAMIAWFEKHGFTRANELAWPTQKPVAYLTIDDRAFRFEGDFPSEAWLLRFRPWNAAARGGRE